MENMITEKMQTPSRYRCDVCVCGGGVAGIAAALAAARAGGEVILLERGFMLGGLATAGLVTIYLPICDGMGHQVSFGIAEELLRLSIEYGAEDKYPYAWLDGESAEHLKAQERFLVQYNAQMFAISAEKLLKAEGVHILYGAYAVAAPTADGKITHIVIEGKSGREAIQVRRSVVDCTGDADICKLAGAKTALHGEGNILAGWYYAYGEGKHQLQFCGAVDMPAPDAETELPNKRRYTGVDTREVSEMVMDSHAATMSSLLKKRQTAPDTVISTLTTVPQLRMTRRLVGEYEQCQAEDHAYFQNSVGMYADWTKKGPVFELPFTALYGKEVKNLLTAGRCISVADDLWNVTRVIPVCAVSGEAAGAAAAMSDDMTRLDVAVLQAHLRAQGVRLHIDEAE